MIKKLTKHGNSLALVIDRPILQLLEIDPDTPLSVTTDGRHLIITPAAHEGEDRRFRKALGKVNRRYGKALKRLAE